MKCADKQLNLDKPAIMGIINLTPDSFSDGGDFYIDDNNNSFIDRVHSQAKIFINQGAYIIDLGAESSRPGAEDISAKTQLERLLPTIAALKKLDCLISIDTRDAYVAQACLDAGAHIINDVSGFAKPEMRKLARSTSCGLIVMHSRGNPKTMQDMCDYEDVVLDVLQDLEDRTGALVNNGVDPARICIDPGIGFAKTAGQSMDLLKPRTTELFSQNFPLLCAVSRKSFIGRATGVKNPKGRDQASALIAANTAYHGAKIIRTHNVEATQRALNYSLQSIIAIGSNVGDSAEIIHRALLDLAHDPHIWLCDTASLYISEAAYYTEQPSFTNTVCCIQTNYTAAELLATLHKIEDRHGRIRTIEKGPRTLDLDIVDMQDLCIRTGELFLPHPLAYERDFVITPLREILPNYVFADGTNIKDLHPTVGAATLGDSHLRVANKKSS
ncbi:MAG: dihydropteroate synthase [Coriobacteriales bacterium]|nr:dihydropteroate synthase [Coriobacteriales bacterium]